MDYSISSGLITHSKNFKTPFLRAISNSCHGLTVIGLEPIPKNFGEKTSIILSARPPQSLDKKRGAADAQVVL